jgi:hypothetical protein
MMVKNPHSYPIEVLTQSLEFCIAELENSRSTLDMDLVYIRGVDERIRRYRDLSTKSNTFLKGLIREAERIIKERKDRPDTVSLAPIGTLAPTSGVFEDG